MLDYPKLLSDLRDCSEDVRNNTLRHLCLTDLFFLAVYVIGQTFVDCGWGRRYCGLIQADNRNTMDLAFRGGFKTTLITIDKTIQDHLNDPTLCTNIYGFKAPIGQKSLIAIKSICLENEALNHLFPDIIPQGRDQDTMLTNDKVIFYGKPASRRESSIDYSGLVEGMPTSMHYDRSIYDDIVTKDSVATIDSIMKVVEGFRSSRNIVSNREFFRIIGTRYKYDDPYSYIMEDYKDFLHVRRIPAIGPDGSMPYYSKEQLAQKLVEMGSYEFSCQMQQDPVSSEGRYFGEPLLYDQLPEGDYTKVVLIDPALSEKRSADDCVIALVCFDRSRRIWVDQCHCFKGKSTDNIRRVFRNIIKIYQPTRGGCELVAFQKCLKEPLTEEIQQAYEAGEIDRPFYFEELKEQTTTKEVRIRALQPHYELGMLHVRRGLDQLIRQIRDYPGTRHDDAIDAVAYIMEFLPSGRFLTANARTDEMLRRYQRPVYEDKQGRKYNNPVIRKNGEIIKLRRASDGPAEPVEKAPTQRLLEIIRDRHGVPTKYVWSKTGGKRQSWLNPFGRRV